MQTVNRQMTQLKIRPWGTLLLPKGSANGDELVWIVLVTLWELYPIGGLRPNPLELHDPDYLAGWSGRNRQRFPKRFAAVEELPSVAGQNIYNQYPRLRIGQILHILDRMNRLRTVVGKTTGKRRWMRTVPEYGETPQGLDDHYVLRLKSVEAT